MSRLTAAQPQTRTETASRSASKATSVTSPRSSPSSWSGIGRVAPDRDPVGVVQLDEGQPRPAGGDVADGPRERADAQRPWREQVEASFEPRAAGQPQRQPAEIRVRVGVRHERERRAAVALDLEGRVEADTRLGERLDGRPGEDRIAGPLAVGAPAARVHAADQLGVEPDPGGEAEPAPVGAPESRSAASVRPRAGARRRPGRAAAPAPAAARSSRRRGRSRGPSPAARRSTPR